jgi:hypothetical protein
MAIAQDTIITVGTGATAKTFGVSKSLDNYTLNDLKTIADWSFSAYQDNLWNANFFDGGYNKTAQIWDTGRSASVHLYKFPSYQIYIEGSRLSGALFTRNVLIYCNTDVNWAGANIYHGLSTLSRYHVVTDIEIQELKLNLGNNPDTVVTSMPTCKLGINDVRICPMQLIIDEEDNIYLCLIQNWNGAQGGAGNRKSQLVMRGISYDNVEIAYYDYGTGNNGMKTIDGTLNKVLGPSGIDFALHTAGSDEVYTTGTEPVKVERTSGGGYNYFKYTLQSANTEAPYLTFAYAGIRFNDGTKDYKPIVENGMIIGYTDDDSVTSEFDSWTSIKDHVTPSEPPSPTPSEDDSYADMGIGVGTGVGGYTSFAIMTEYDLVDLLGDFNTNLEDGMSVVNNFICLYKLGPLASSLCNTRVGNIIMSANASVNFVSIRADYNIVTSQKNVITLGSYNVPRMTNTFYDFAPYSTYELFIPCCGWVPLPDTVAGRQITVYLIIDLSSCTCKGICRIGGTTVAEASGVLGVSVPFFSTDSGIKRASDLMAVTQVISGIAQGTVGAGAGAGALVVSGSANALQGLEQLYINGNTNYTAIKGGNGDITAVGNGEYCTIKIAHPKVDEVVNNSKFGHSVGYLCNTVDKIKNFKGLTICANPHVNGIDCTESEKEEIKRLLEEGIIVN